MRQINILIITALIFASCNSLPPNPTNESDNCPEIFPDYISATVPFNICPLNFKIQDSENDSWASFQGSDEFTFTVKSIKGKFNIPESKWRKITANSDSISVTVTVATDCQTTRYKPFIIYISRDKIDKCLTYRLIEPGYQKFTEMGIYQRNIETFSQKEILSNHLTDHSCINCHSFCNQNPEKFLFHLRVNYPGTYIIDGDKIERLDTKTDRTISAFVYPYWHPSGKFVAFSTNNTQQIFHTADPNRIEVFDHESDVLVYDIENHQALTPKILSSKENFETFPTFSPDGKTLYFCSAASKPVPDSCKAVKYNLMKISFDAQTKTFGNKIDTVFNAEAIGKSCSFPRVSPDGKMLIITLSDYGNFSIWHQESDLYKIDFSDNSVCELQEINSNRPDSYHSFSSNSRWMVIASRRLDGLYTRPFITHIDERGKFSKPFLLPQQDPDYYTFSMKSFNIPEFSKEEITLTPHKLSSSAQNLPEIKVE